MKQVEYNKKKKKHIDDNTKNILAKEKLIVIKKAEELNYELITIYPNIKKQYRIILEVMIQNANSLLTCLLEANGIATIRKKIDKIGEAIALLRNIASSVVQLYQLNVIYDKRYRKLANIIENIRRYIIGWQNYWIKELRWDSW